MIYMTTKRLALRVTLQSLSMILGVYIVMQAFTYWKDNVVLGLTGIGSMPAMVASFIAFNVLPPALLFGLLLFFLAFRIQRIGERLEAGELIPAAEIERTRTRLLHFSTVVLVINLMGFAAGYILLMILRGRALEMLRPDRLIILISNMAGGVVYAFAQTSLHNMAFSDIRERLGIREIGSRKRERRSTTKQAFITISLVLYVATFIQFNVRDAIEYDIAGDEVLASVVSGTVARENAAAEFRRLLGARLSAFISRSDVDIELVPAPWERPDSAATRAQRVFFIFAFFMLVVAAGVQITISLDVREQLAAISRRIRDVLDGGGDLRIRLNLRSMDDLGELTDLINRMLDSFHGVARGIASAAGQNRESASAIDRELVLSEGLAKRSLESVRSMETTLTEQAKQTGLFVAALRSFRNSVAKADEATADQKRFVAETSAAMEEMATSIRSISTMTAHAGELSGELAERGESGGTAVRDTRTAIDEIDGAAREVLGVLASLNKIAGDTNLLAMNAAIEAAHAGAHGQGFAVVADEVRNLANKAAKHTNDIKNLISAMGARVRNGVQRADVSGVVLSRLVEGIKESASISREISEAAREQTVGANLVLGSITMAVESARTVGDLMTDQSRKSDDIAQSLENMLMRLEALADAASRQSGEVQALEASFSAVRREVDANLKTVGDLDSNMVRFKI